jgi:hypothetical protein
MVVFFLLRNSRLTPILVERLTTNDTEDWHQSQQHHRHHHPLDVENFEPPKLGGNLIEFFKFYISSSPLTPKFDALEEVIQISQFSDDHRPCTITKSEKHWHAHPLAIEDPLEPDINIAQVVTIKQWHLIQQQFRQAVEECLWQGLWMWAPDPSSQSECDNTYCCFQFSQNSVSSRLESNGWGSDNMGWVPSTTQPELLERHHKRKLKKEADKNSHTDHILHMVIQ